LATGFWQREKFDQICNPPVEIFALICNFMVNDRHWCPQCAWL